MSAPAFKIQPSSSELTLKASPEAEMVAQKSRRQDTLSAWRVKLPARVREEARARLSKKGGNPLVLEEMLAEYELQFGQYRGQTFRWLLENDVGYACAIIASHEKEREGESGNPNQAPLMVHKDALTTYARRFPQMVAAIARRRMSEGSRSVRGLDDKQLGFGAHAHVTFKSLYESKKRECRS